MPGGKNTHLTSKNLGYTIVEVMIVLAVSGLMFVIAAGFINGKQQKTAFTEGSNELGAQIQSMVDDVADGHYSDIPLTCNSGGGGALSVSVTTGDTQGRNSECVFLGKLVHFYNPGGGSGNPRSYETISVADKKSAANDNLGSSVTLIDGLTTQKSISQNLQISGMRVFVTNGGGPQNAWAVGFVQGSGTVSDPATGSYDTGAQTTSIVYAPSTNQTAAANNGTINGHIQHAASAQICVTDGTRNAVIQIGGSNEGNQLNATVNQRGASPCW